LRGVAPRIVCIAGPLKDSVFELPSAEVSIGRGTSNLLCLADRALSREHCLLIREGERFSIRDLDSHNGTFINGVQVKEHGLKHGDQIAIGESMFIFLLDEGDNAVSPDVIFDHEAPDLYDTIELRAEDVLYLQPEKILEALPTTARLARALNALLQVSWAIHALRRPKELQDRLLSLILDFIPAERGAIFLVDSNPEGLSSTCTHRQMSDAQPLRISRTVTHHVLKEGVAVLCNHVKGTSFDTSTMLASHVTSFLCVPIKLFNQVIGCIYLDATRPETRFDEDQLQLVTAIAAIFAIAFDNARRMESLRAENQRLNAEIDIEHNMVGTSPTMRRVYEFVARVAPADSTVLIQGESGTGKELVARALHRNSLRAEGPFVAINCAAIAETLLESELFGHEKGAFTGATAQKKGKLEVADGGTVFLDEVSELAPALQAKLLRVLQEREFERLGGTRPIKLDVRLIAATNKQLKEVVKAGAFREDLFYRLNVVTLTIPALREHREDIPALANYFVNLHARKAKRRPKAVSLAAQARLMNYDWPGNIRELENAIEHALVLGCGEEILPEDLPEAVLDKEPLAELGSSRYHAAVIALKKQLILKALQESGGNYTEAARLLGVHPNYLHRLIRNLNLKAPIKTASSLRSA
jgi:transcriptional regulator with GAF, ATPase, and Fis domain